MNVKAILLTATLSLLVATGCQKKLDFLYFGNTPQHIHADHKLKELIGNNNLDILWVIDNSSSMLAHQQTVIANLTQFTNGLSANSTLHWKAGLISTDSNDPPYIGFRANDQVDYTMPNAAARFQQAVAQLGTYGDAIEKTFDPVVQVLTQYPGFLRANAALAIIVVSDAPEQSYQINATQFVQDLIAWKGGDVSKIYFYGFLNPVDWCTPTDDYWNWAGSPFQAVLNQVKGDAFKLCDQTFASNLANLGANLASNVSSPRFDLAQKPLVESIHVYHNGTEVPGAPNGFWYYDRNLNAVVFTDLSFAPGSNEFVTIDFDVDDGTVPQ